MPFFELVKELPPDPIFGLNQAFAADPRGLKVNLGAGVYKTDALESFVFHTVKKAESYLLDHETTKDYLSIDGLQEYVELTKVLVFGSGVPFDQIYGAQSVGGTAALRICSDFLYHHGYDSIYISEPTWMNHRRIFSDSGLKIQTYAYYDAQHHQFDFKGFCGALKQMAKKSIVLLQGCCHNPTGFDPSYAQWEEILILMKQYDLFPFFDFAYQGFGISLEKDAEVIRLFTKSGIQIAVAVSHSKNFGLYGERTGALYFVCQDQQEMKKIGSQIKSVIRGLYSNPPCHGAKIVSLILKDQDLKRDWLKELAGIRDRISKMRHMLVNLLQRKTHHFDFLAHQLGMFAYTSLTVQEVEKLMSEYGIYLPKDGRINVAGLNEKNIDYVVDALNHVTINR
ncbi:MAG: amino acid aminotransferase [Chlamydiales bacterium]